MYSLAKGALGASARRLLTTHLPARLGGTLAALGPVVRYAPRWVPSRRAFFVSRLDAMNFDVRDTRNSNWLWMRRELLREHGDKLGVYGVAVYAALASFADESNTAYPSIQSISDMVDCSPNKVRESIRNLCRLGWLGYQERQEESGRQTSHLFYLLECPVDGDPSQHEGGTPHSMKGDPSRDEDEVERKEVSSSNSAGARKEKPKAVQIYEDIFPRQLRERQAEKVADKVDDMDLWRAVLDWWSMNGHRAKSVGRMLNKYRQTDTKDDLYRDRPAGDGAPSEPEVHTVPDDPRTVIR